MRYFALSLMFVCSIFFICEEGVAQEAEIYEGSYIRRPTLMVKDMDQSLSLYRDILGFQLGNLKVDHAESYAYTVFNIPQGTEIRHATFDTDKEKRVLSLVEVKSMPNRTEHNLRTSTVLINANGRLTEILSQLESDGYMILPEHKLGETGKEVGFIDRDGHLIVLYEFPSR